MKPNSAGSWKVKVSIRYKVIALIAGALSVSLLSCLYVGTSLMIGDKVSYIYDYNLSEVSGIAERLSNQIQQAVSAANVMAALVNRKMPDSNHGVVSQAFEKASKDNRMPVLVLKRAYADGSLAEELALGANAPSLQKAMSEMGWDAVFFKERGLAVGAALEGKLPVAGVSLDANGEKLVFTALVDLDPAFLKEGRGSFQVRLLDSAGKVVLSNMKEGVETETLTGFDASILQSKFSSGVRELADGKNEYVVGYKRLALNGLLVLGYVSKAEAYTAARTLLFRSVAIGISILLAAIGLTFLIVTRLTSRLTLMWQATQRVSQGDFSARVPVSSGSDEVESLASSFNTMADRIDVLMEETAQKARIDKELETAQMLQKRFFPEAPFKHQTMSVAGSYVPATECSGDWWSYAMVGDNLIVVIGDVTGHGVSAALVTAAAHGAFSTIVEDMKHASGTALSVKGFIQRMNAAVYAAAGNEATMTFCVSVIDLVGGSMTSVNASHRPPYVCGQNKVTPVMGGQCAALGQNPVLEVEPVTTQLAPGDLVLWYTDGLLECKNKSGKTIDKKEFVKSLGGVYEKNAADAKRICDSIMSDSLRFFGVAQGEVDAREDDITVVVATVSPQAQFKKLALAA